MKTIALLVLVLVGLQSQADESSKVILKLSAADDSFSFYFGNGPENDRGTLIDKTVQLSNTSSVSVYCNVYGDMQVMGSLTALVSPKLVPYDKNLIWKAIQIHGPHYLIDRGAQNVGKIMERVLNPEIRAKDSENYNLHLQAYNKELELLGGRMDGTIDSYRYEIELQTYKAQKVKLVCSLDQKLENLQELVDILNSQSDTSGVKTNIQK